MTAMAKLHLAALALVALALLSTFSAGSSGFLTGSLILAMAAGKGATVLSYFLGLDRATLGWRIGLVGFVVLTCALAGGVYAAGPYLHS